MALMSYPSTQGSSKRSVLLTEVLKEKDVQWYK